MRELEILISKINKIIEGYIFSGRFGDTRFDINNAAKFDRFLLDGSTDKKSEAAANEQPQSTLKSITDTAYKSSAYIYSLLEAGIRWSTNNPKTLHRFPTIEWLYAIRFKLMTFNLEFENIRTSVQLMQFQKDLFALIDDLFLTVDVLMRTPSDDTKPIIKNLDKDYSLVGLQDNESELGKLFRSKLLKKQGAENYRVLLKAALDKEILTKDDVICASGNIEKSKRDMHGAVSELQSRVNQLTRDLELNQHLVEVRTRQMDESDARWDKLQKELRLKDQARVELQLLVDKLGKEKAKISKALAEQRREDKDKEAQLKEDKDRRLELEARMRELEEKHSKAEREAREASEKVVSLTSNLEQEREVKSVLKVQLTAMQEQTKVVEEQLQQPGMVLVEPEQQAQAEQYPALSELEQRRLIQSLQEADKSEERDKLTRTLLSLNFSEDEDQADELEQAAVEEPVESLGLVNTEQVNAHMQDYIAANFRRVYAYPHIVEPEPKLQCTAAQYFVRQTNFQKLAAALNANPNLLNAICVGSEKELKTKSLVEIALFHTKNTILYREERLAVLCYLLDRQPDISNTMMYESIKENLNNPKVSCNSDLKTEYCLYATAHKTCSPDALDEFYKKYNAIKTAKAFLKKHTHVVLFDNKPVSQLLAEMQKELYACKLLCDGYIHGHFDAFKANTSDAPKDLFAALNLILLDALGQKESDKAYLKKHGRFHYQAQLLSTLEPKYAECIRYTVGGTNHKFPDKITEDQSDPLNNNAVVQNSNNDSSKGMRLFNKVDESIEPLFAAYGELVKNLFLMISRYGVVLSAKDGFNKYQTFLINKRLGANMQAQIMMSREDHSDDGSMKRVSVRK